MTISPTCLCPVEDYHARIIVSGYVTIDLSVSKVGFDNEDGRSFMYLCIYRKKDGTQN